MKNRTIAVIAAILVPVNIGLAITIYVLLNPDVKITVPKIEVTQEDVDDLKASVKTSFYEKAQLTVGDDEPVMVLDAEQEATTGEYYVEQWGLTFTLPENVNNYSLTIRGDLLTIEKHIQVLAYVARYEVGVAPSIVGEWELLATYNNQSYYLGKGTSVVGEEFDEQLDAQRNELYQMILKTYHFQQEP